MAKREILAGATDQTIDVFVNDSSSTTGGGLTGLVYNTASLVCYYRKGATGTPTALTLATQTVGGAHSDGGFVAVDGTNCPGQYRLDLSDTIVATAGMVTIYLRGAANMVPCVTEIEVVSVNKFDAVRMGMTALPNAAAEASGGLYTRGTGAGQINQNANGQIDANSIALSGDSAAADNAEAFFDGTGYAGTNNVIPTVTTVGTLTTYTGNTPQTGDAYARIGATGSGLTSLAPSATALSTVQWTNARAGYLDNLNVGGAVASQADITALNQSASRRIILTTVGQYERPESGSVTYTVEARTFDGDGAATNADSDPTLTATGIVSGSLAANLGTVSNPATGVYRWAYTVANNATNEQIRFDVSATMSTAFTLSVYTQVVDLVSATWTSSDASKLTAVYNKLPTNNIADQTLLTASIGALNNLSAAQVNAEVDTAIADAGLATASALTTVGNNVTTLLNRITSTLFSGITSLASWLGALAGKTADSSTQTEIRATTAGAGYTITTDSMEAIADAAAAIKAKSDNLPASPAATGDAMTLTSGERNSVADAILTRSVSNVQAGAAEHSLCSVVLATLESIVVGTTWTIYRTDGSTTYLVKTVTKDAAADPITGVS